MPGILALGRLRWDNQKFEASLLEPQSKTRDDRETERQRERERQNRYHIMRKLLSSQHYNLWSRCGGGCEGVACVYGRHNGGWVGSLYCRHVYYLVFTNFNWLLSADENTWEFQLYWRVGVFYSSQSDLESVF
jgi:hypothetical protein